MSGLLKRTVYVFFLTTLFVSAAPSNVSAQAITPERRVELERELANLESQIAAQRAVLSGKQQESASLERDIAILDAKIKTAQLAIKARDITIRQLSSDIGNKQETIGQLDSKLSREKQSLAQLLRKTYELDSYSIAEFALGSESLSDFFSDVDSFTVIKKELQDSFVEIGETREETQTEKEALEERRAEQLELRQLQVLEQRAIQAQEAERQKLLKETKGQEKIYQQLLAEKEKSAATIRATLFSLTGTGAIPFGKAYQYALEASQKTGVRPAFILGVIAEESNLGENVGTGNWKIDMHPTRDRPVFEVITRELGLNPDSVPVSKKAWYGWGGAMGPAQFIPSTWILYKERIGEITGSNPPNPWDPRTAFFASAILLKDNGADKGTRASERLAALRYLAGWKNAEKPAYAFYGDDVMNLADKYQAQINILTGSGN